jgi:hypothetical protein
LRPLEVFHFDAEDITVEVAYRQIRPERQAETLHGPDLSRTISSEVEARKVDPGEQASKRWCEHSGREGWFRLAQRWSSKLSGLKLRHGEVNEPGSPSVGKSLRQRRSGVE